MPVDIYFSGAGEPLRTAVSYDAHSLAHEFSTKTGQVPHVGDYVTIKTIDDQDVLVNPSSVAYLRQVTG